VAVGRRAGHQAHRHWRGDRPGDKPGAGPSTVCAISGHCISEPRGAYRRRTRSGRMPLRGTARVLCATKNRPFPLSREDATVETLTSTLKSTAKGMDVQNGIPFVILTSHGSLAGLAVKAGKHQETMSPSQLLEARLRRRASSRSWAGGIIRQTAT